MSYQHLLKETTPSALQQTTHPLYNEIEIQSHWFSGHFPSHYTDNLGQNINIISPGEWNHGPGPDFINATIEIDQIKHHGPIELDLHAQDWDHHGHRDSAHFDNVILHITLHNPDPTHFTRTSKNRHIPRIVLDPEDINHALGKPRLTQALARPGRCLTPLANLSHDNIQNLLQQAAQHRAKLKANRFNQTKKLHSFSQALWEHLADSLGYSNNRLPMRLLAQRLPIQKLLKYAADDREAILFGTAGFLHPDLHQKAPTESQQYLQALWTRWWKHRQNHESRPSLSPDWTARSTRPGNHPQRRLAALVAASNDWNNLTSFALEPAPFKSLSQTLTHLTHPFWDHHHTLRSRKTDTPIKLIGKSRLNEFLINTLYPLNIEDDWPTYQSLTTSAPNQKIKRCAERLFGSLTKAKPHLKFAWQHQALLQIYQDFCLEDLSDCESCRFPQQLANINTSRFQT